RAALGLGPELAMGKERRPRLAGVVAPHAGAPRSGHERPRLGWAEAIAEGVARHAAHERPRDVQTPPPLVLQEEPRPGPHHTSDLPYHAPGLVDEVERAARADDGVEGAIAVGQCAQIAADEARAGQASLRHRQARRREIEAMQPIAQLGENDRLKAGAASGIERPRIWRSGTQSGSQDPVKLD